MNVKKMIAGDGLIILGVVILGGIIYSYYSPDHFILSKEYFAVIKKTSNYQGYPAHFWDNRALKRGLSLLFLPIVFIIWAIKTLRKP